jgi:hypothetical protein
MAADHPIATLRAGVASLAVELNPAWTAKGQYWRIEKEITASAKGADAAAERLRGEIEDLRRRVADATRRTGEPFPQAASLETARARRDAIQQEIRDAAAPPEDDSGEPGPVHDDLLGAAMDDALALAGMDSAQEVTFTPAMISPQNARPAEDAENAGSLDSPPDLPDAAPALSVLSETGSMPAHAELTQAEPAPAERGHPPGPAAASRAAVKPSRPPTGRPALLASLGGPVEPLFALPVTAPEQAGEGQIPRTHRAARPRGMRRRPAQAAARDHVQGALFDLPPPGAEPARPTAAARNQTRAPRR